ncbi:hypothetical protein LWI28_026054 [Acer negundo]|uniref:SCP domain-containing protein n=1 Tax=Acer negundo TaxID=4023 RepID=A0AAD5JEL4_ACENE|nr:hypothetical protein LWI28_026054 [Acer negundo]
MSNHGSFFKRFPPLIFFNGPDRTSGKGSSLLISRALYLPLPPFSLLQIFFKVLSIFSFEPLLFLVILNFIFSFQSDFLPSPCNMSNGSHSNETHDYPFGLGSGSEKGSPLVFNLRKKKDHPLSDNKGGPYGENIAWSSGDLTGTTVVKLWVDEKPKYNYNSNSCIGGECRHYTQVVWHNSVHLGCAKVKCDNGQGTFITCNYDPPGNFVNQRPY